MIVAVDEVGDEEVSVEIWVLESRSLEFESLSSSRGGGGGKSSNFSESAD